MSQRVETRFTCDLCQVDIADPRKGVHVAMRGGPARGVDVGPCCAGRPIADLVATANRMKEVYACPTTEK